MKRISHRAGEKKGKGEGKKRAVEMTFPKIEDGGDSIAFGIYPTGPVGLKEDPGPGKRKSVRVKVVEKKDRPVDLCKHYGQ